VPGDDTFADLTMSAFSERLASADATPGGGSAAAVTAALAGSLVAMVARLSLDRPKYAAYEATLRRALEAGGKARVRFLAFADEDASAYAGFADALKLPRDTDDQVRARQAAIRQAARQASEVPLAVVRECHALMGEIEALAGRSNLNASSDLDVAALLTEAAARGAGANVIVNLPSVEDDAFAGRRTAELTGLLHEIETGASWVHRRALQGKLRGPEDV
jgi:formiminotetrahydrofolate cyclodeaminase